MCVCSQVHVCLSTSVEVRGQRTTFKISSFLPLCVPGIKLRSSGLYGKYFHPLSQRA